MAVKLREATVSLVVKVGSTWGLPGLAGKGIGVLLVLCCPWSKSPHILQDGGMGGAGESD